MKIKILNHKKLLLVLEGLILAFKTKENKALGEDQRSQAEGGIDFYLSHLCELVELESLRHGSN